LYQGEMVRIVVQEKSICPSRAEISQNVSFIESKVYLKRICLEFKSLCKKYNTVYYSYLSSSAVNSYLLQRCTTTIIMKHDCFI